MLVHRAGHGNVLANGQPRERREQSIDFRGAGAISIDPGVGLLETNAGGQRKRLILRELRAQISGNDLHALVMELPAEVGLAFDIDQPGLTESR